MVTNQTVSASTSVASALATIDTALQSCREQMARLEGQSRTHLPVFTALKDRFERLHRHRRELESARSGGCRALDRADCRVLAYVSVTQSNRIQL